MLLRNAFLYLSQQPQLRRFMESSRFAHPLTERFIAGKTLKEALDRAAQLRSAGILAALVHLGENVSTPEEANAATEAYLLTLDRIADSGLEASVSGKLTQFGLDISEDLCVANTQRIALRACQAATRLEIDMEDSRYTQQTLDIIRNLHKTTRSFRAVIQAYLYRSEKDVELLNAQEIPVRLCKGAYNEPESIAFRDKGDVDQNFIRLTRMLLERGTYPAIATHDPKMLEATKAMARELAISPDRFEFQMLHGIRRDLQRQLVKEGYRVRVYVPYGNAWYPYFMRRLAERPANVFFLIRNLFRS